MLPLHRRARFPWIDVAMCLGIWTAAVCGLVWYKLHIGFAFGPQFSDWMMLASGWVWGALLQGRMAAVVARVADRQWREDLAVTQVSARDFLRGAIDRRVLLTATWLSAMPMQVLLFCIYLVQHAGWDELPVILILLALGSTSCLIGVAGVWEALRLQCRHEHQRHLWVVVPAVTALISLAWPIAAVWALEEFGPPPSSWEVVLFTFVTCATIALFVAWHRRRAAIRQYLEFE